MEKENNFIILKWTNDRGEKCTKNYTDNMKAIYHSILYADVYGFCYLYYADFCYKVVREYYIDVKESD